MLIRSEEFNSAPWGANAAITITPNTEIAPNGTLTADTVSNSSAGANFLQSGTIDVSPLVQYVFSFYAKKGTGVSTIAEIFNNNAGASFASLNYSSLTSTTEWTRISVPFTPPAGCFSVGCRPRSNDGTGSVHIWGAQVERSTTARAYIPTTTAAVYGPRFDHDPVTLASRGLLIEESRTNLKNGSQDFSNTYWAGSFATRNNNNSQSPDGTTTACLVTGAGTSFGGLVRGSAATLASTTYTLSCFAKAGTHNFLGLSIQNAGTSSGLYSHFNLSTGVATAVTPISGTTVSASMTPFPNGWYRCVLVYTTASTQPATSAIDISITQSNGQHDYLGTGNLFIWGAQLEAGSFPTSYIPTTTGTLARSADVCNITGANFTSFWNRFAGTVVIGVGSSLGSSPAIVSNSLAARALEIFAQSSIDFYEASGNQLVRIASNITFPLRVGLAYAINDYQGSSNGILGGTDTNTGGTIPDATQLNIGNLGGEVNRLTGHIQFIRYYKKRLPNAKLAQLTV